MPGIVLESGIVRFLTAALHAADKFAPGIKNLPVPQIVPNYPEFFEARDGDRDGGETRRVVLWLDFGWHPLLATELELSEYEGESFRHGISKPVKLIKH